MLFSTLITVLISNAVTINDAWVRPGGKGMNTALYCTVTNNSDNADTLLSVSSSIADIVQIHETYMKGNMMGMRQVKSITLDPHASLQLKPGGFHIMVINLKEDVLKNDTVDFTLHFKKAGAVDVKALVK